MLNVLVAIAHYYKADPHSEHGYGRDTPERRVAIVSDCLRALLANFAVGREHVIQVARSDGSLAFENRPADEEHAIRMDIAICTTTGDEHVLPLLDVPETCYRHVKVSLENPRNLGYGALQYLQMNRGRYDYYCYMEDDGLIHDPAFFWKLAWFESLFGPDAVLLPHRYTLSASAQKVYTDPELHDAFITPWMDFASRPRLSAPLGGRVMQFEKPHNPHAGAFFLSSAQFERFCEREENFTPTPEFISPLESAATLGLMKTFDVYKPAFSQASFFEMEHHGARL